MKHFLIIWLIWCLSFIVAFVFSPMKQDDSAPCECKPFISLSNEIEGHLKKGPVIISITTYSGNIIQQYEVDLTQNGLEIFGGEE